jgi:hypothetical protein
MDSLMSHTAKNEAAERFAEIARILATGLQRGFARQSSTVSQEFGESSLHSSPGQSADDPVSENRERG